MPEELAQCLGISPLTAKAWLRCQRLPVARIGDQGQLRIREAGLDAHMRRLAEESAQVRHPGEGKP
jgi:excisionase family DNA binding protein